MSRPKYPPNAVPRCLVALAAVLAWSPSLAHAQGPQPGEVQRFVVITLRLQVGSTEVESRRATYTPPPGWYIRSHCVECTQRYGNSSYAVSTVPAGWVWASDERDDESSRRLVGVAARAHDVGVQAKLRLDRDDVARQARDGSYSHHALVVDATARGEGLFRGASGIELTVMAELVYVGIDQPGPLPRCHSLDAPR